MTPAAPVLPKHCFNCVHGSLELKSDTVHCAHPQRPHPKGHGHRTEIIRWAVGCPQHSLKPPREVNYG
jgi:hypothetical protein